MPFVPGSPVDAAARVITQHIQTRLGQNMVIENKPGGGTTIGLKAVMAAPPDGYTLLFIGPNLVYTPVLYPSMNFDPFKSLAPVASVVTWSHVMVVAPAVPAKTVKELVAHIKANPGKVTFGYGLATTPHILSETFRQVTGADFAGMPYRGGEQARADLLGGRIDINMAPTANLLALIQDGKARPLAFTGPKAQPGSAGRADHDRKRLSAGRLQSGCLARLPGADRHAGCRGSTRSTPRSTTALRSAEMKPMLAQARLRCRR